MNNDNFEGKKFLVVEDQVFVQKIMELKLKQTGAEIICAENGQKALEILEQFDYQIDLIILDLMMPVMNGYEFLKKIKSEEISRKIPVLISSAKNSKNDILEAIELGALDYVSKPFNYDITIKKIKNIFSKVSKINTYRKLDNFPLYYENAFLYIKCEHENVNADFIDKIINTVTNYKEDIAIILIDLTSVNLTPDNCKYFNKIFLKLSNISDFRILVKNQVFLGNFKIENPMFYYKIDTEISKLLPNDINESKLSNLKSLDSTLAKYESPVTFKDEIPVIEYYAEPSMESAEKLLRTIDKLILYKKNKIIINFNNIINIPARFGGILYRINTDITTKHNGKFFLVIKNEQLVNKLKIDGFISKFTYFTDEKTALDNIK